MTRSRKARAGLQKERCVFRKLEPIESKSTDAFRSQLLNLGIVSLMAAPAVIGLGGPIIRFLFPVMAFLISGYFLIIGRLSQYVTFCLWLFLLTPAVRRLVDLHSGWEALNFLLLAPYAAASFSGGAMASLAGSKWSSASLAFVGIVSAATYGFTIAAVDGRIFAGLFDYLRWTIPPCLALLIIMNPAHFSKLKADVLAAFTLALLLLGSYGLYQFYNIPAWDAFWMRNVEMNSIGLPEPYKVRIFSTMNSPGVFATFLSTGITLAMTKFGPFQWIAVPVGLSALALTLVRTSWLGLLISVALLFLFGTVKLRWTLAIVLGVSVLLAPFALLVPEAKNILEERTTSVTELSGDNSYNERLAGYANFFDRIGEGLLGQGLGANGAYQSYADQRKMNVVDGGPIEILSALGPLVGTVYFALLGVIVWKCITVRAAAEDRVFVLGLKSIIVASIVLLSGSTTVTGEIGIYAWLAVGLCLSAGEWRRYVSRKNELF